MEVDAEGPQLNQNLQLALFESGAKRHNDGTTKSNQPTLTATTNLLTALAAVRAVQDANGSGHK